MNAATSIITTKSPYIARTSSTTPQLNYTLGTWAAKNGVKTVYTMVSDYGPGHRRRNRVPDRLQGSRRHDRRLGALPGRQSGLLRLRPARQGHQPGRHLHLDPRRRPAGRRRQGAGRARRRSVQDQGDGPGRARPTRPRCKSMGDAALGIITVSNYDYNHQSAMNQEFVKAYQRRIPSQPGHLLGRRL